MSSSDQKIPISNGENLLTALISGTTAGAASATITYPLDSFKTQYQLNNQTLLSKFKLEAQFANTWGQIYKGGSALVIGSLFKNSARLILYSWLTKFMAVDTHAEDGVRKRKTSAPRIVIAGAMSGFIETLWIVPFENIKITMIQNMLLRKEIQKYSNQFDVTGGSKHHKPVQSHLQKQYLSPHAYYTSDVLAQIQSSKSPSKFSGQPRAHHSTPRDLLKIRFNKHSSTTFFGTINEIYSLKGIRGFAAGTCITFLRQASVSFVWLSTYNTARQWLDPHSSNTELGWFGHKHTTLQLMGIHVFSSLAVITATQPFDVVKSHLQLKNGKKVYKDSLTTAYKLFVNQGPRSLYKGALPRGVKVLVSGGLTAGIYSWVENVVGVAGGQILFGE